MTKNVRLDLIIESDKGKKLSGRVIHKGNLIVVESEAVWALEAQITDILNESGTFGQISFRRKYDVYALFKTFEYLNVTKVAERIGMNPGLLRQYASGAKYPNKTQAENIEKGLNQLGEELKNVKLTQ